MMPHNKPQAYWADEWRTVRTSYPVPHCCGYSISTFSLLLLWTNRLILGVREFPVPFLPVEAEPTGVPNLAL